MFLKWGCSDFRKNTFPTIGRKCIFAVRPDFRGFTRRLVLQFYWLGMEIFEIKKKSSVFGQSIAEHRP